MGKEHWARILHKDQTPGPGAYDIETTIGKDSLKFTIRKRIPKKIDEAHCVPMLNLPNTLSQKAVILPPHGQSEFKSAREPFQTPGPSYIPEPLGKKPLSARVPKRGENYENSRNYSSPGHNNCLGGPASYNVRTDLVKETVPIVIGGRLRRKCEETEGPGPAKYAVREPVKKQFSKSCSFGIRTPLSRSSGASPGPVYKVDSDFGKKNVVIRERFEVRGATDVTPGPGAYETDHFGKGARSKSLKSGRGGEIIVKDAPPYYMLPSTLNLSTGKTIGTGRASPLRRKDKKSDGPGPAKYYAEKPRKSNPNSFGWRKYKKDTPNHRAQIKSEEPSPATYSPNYFAGKSGSPSFSFKDDCGAVSIAVHEPAPPFYSVREKFGQNSPSFTIRQRIDKAERKCFTADAGYYLLPDTNEGPYFSIRIKDKHDLAPE
jgi:hypothetical protein